MLDLVGPSVMYTNNVWCPRECVTTLAEYNTRKQMFLLSHWEGC